MKRASRSGRRPAKTNARGGSKRAESAALAAAADAARAHHHPARRSTARASRSTPVPSGAAAEIPLDADGVTLRLAGRQVELTNLRKVFFPHLGITKAGLLRYYAVIAPVLLPHLRDRAMVM